MRLIHSLLLVFGFTAVCHAKPITFVIQANGSFAIDGNVYIQTDITLTVKGDTNNHYLKYGYLQATTHDSAQLQVDGVSLIYELLSPMHSVAASWPVKGGNYFLFSPDCNCEIITGPRSNSFATWDMTTSLGPVTEKIMFFAFSPIQTSGGLLTFEYGSDTRGTFTAIVTPEPSSICLCIGSIVLLGIRQRGQRAFA